MQDKEYIMRIKDILFAFSSSISFELLTFELSWADRVFWIDIFKLSVDWNSRSLFLLWLGNGVVELDLLWFHIYKRRK
jgi:hypothetical protein